jgi:hypothetical protein
MAKISKEREASKKDKGVLNGNENRSPSLLAKLLGLSTNGSKPPADKTFFTTADGAAVVNYDELVKDDKFKESAAEVRKFLNKNIPGNPDI